MESVIPFSLSLVRQYGKDRGTTERKTLALSEMSPNGSVHYGYVSSPHGCKEELRALASWYRGQRQGILATTLRHTLPPKLKQNPGEHLNVCKLCKVQPVLRQDKTRIRHNPCLMDTNRETENRVV